MWSHPTRGAWIETVFGSSIHQSSFRRTPPGVRGLKPPYGAKILQKLRSHPTRGAWIETKIAVDIDNAHIVAPHPGCVD